MCGSGTNLTGWVRSWIMWLVWLKVKQEETATYLIVEFNVRDLLKVSWSFSSPCRDMALSHLKCSPTLVYALIQAGLLEMVGWWITVWIWILADIKKEESRSDYMKTKRVIQSQLNRMSEAMPIHSNVWLNTQIFIFVFTRQELIIDSDKVT